MILTITLNPLLELRLSYSNVRFGKENRDPFQEYKAGGKGINVSRQLNKLNIPNLAFMFTGGSNGRQIKNILNNEQIHFTAVQTSAETRIAAVTIDESVKTITTFFGSNGKITKGEADEFKLKLDKMIRNCEMVVFSGSSPSPETDSIYRFGIEKAAEYDKISLCDTYGAHLKECIDAGPTILHNNVKEIESYLNIPLNTGTQIINFLDYLYSKNIKQAYITNGALKTYASNFDYHYSIENPIITAVDETGSGDAFVSGIIYAWHNDLTFEEGLKTASALGAANAGRFDVCNIQFEELEPFLSEVKIYPVGKRIKTIDVTPT